MSSHDEEYEQALQQELQTQREQDDAEQAKHEELQLEKSNRSRFTKRYVSRYSTKKRSLKNNMDLHAFFCDGVARKVVIGGSHQTARATALSGCKC